MIVRRSWKVILLLAFMLALQAFPVTAFAPAVCPSTSKDITIFMFVGALLIALLVLSEVLITIPFFSIIIGIGFIMYSFTMFGCGQLFGWVVLAFGVGIVLWKAVQGFGG